MKKAGYFCYLYMAFSLCSLTAGEWNLTENGKSNASIVIGNPPNASETMAIKELNLYTGKIAGCELTGGKYQIRLSSMKDAPEAMRLRLEKAENPDTFYLKTHGRELVIAGKTPRAMLYGVYTLLENTSDAAGFIRENRGNTLRKPRISGSPTGSTISRHHRSTSGVSASYSPFMGKQAGAIPFNG